MLQALGCRGFVRICSLLRSVRGAIAPRSSGVEGGVGVHPLAVTSGGRP